MAAIKHSLENILHSTTPRLVATSVVVVADSYTFKKLKNGGVLTSGTTTPNNVVLTAQTTVFTVPVYSWEYKTSNGTWTAIAGSTSSITVSNTTYYGTHLGTGTYVQYRCTVTQSGWVTAVSPETTIAFIAETDDPVIIVQSMPVATVGADASGIASGFTTTGNVITVTRGGTALSYNTSGANTFSVVYASQTPISGTGTVTIPTGSGAGSAFTIGVFSAMSTTLVSAKASYTVTVRDAAGTALPTYTVQQTINKVNAGSGVAGKAYALSITGGTRAFAYDLNGNNPSPSSSTNFTCVLYENNVSVTPTTWAWSATGVLSGTSSTSSFTPTLSGTYSVATPTTVTLTTTYTGGATITQVVSIPLTRVGATGTDGTKAITVSCFIWLNSGTPAVPTQAFTLTWPSTVSANPTSWTSSAGTAPGSGYVLYQLNCVVSATASATSTAANWNTGTVSSIGYRNDGTIGIQGAGARIAYTKSTIASPTGTTTSTGSTSLPATGSFGLTSAVFSTSPPTLTTSGEFLYQTDGVYTATGDSPSNTVTWSTPYLSNLKVGSLSAISAELGTVSLSGAGALKTTGKSYGSGAGFFLGYDTSAYKLDLYSSSTSYMQWNGSSLDIKGGTITGGVIQTATAGTYPFIRLDTTSGNNNITGGSSAAYSFTLNASAGTFVQTSDLSGLIDGGGGAGSRGAWHIVNQVGVGVSGYGALYGGYFRNYSSSTGIALFVEGTTKGTVFQAKGGTDTYFTDSGNFAIVSATNGVVLASSGTGAMVANTTETRPFTNNVSKLGSGTHRWTEVYATNGTINTSDKREKEAIKLEALGLSFINQLNPVSYKWKSGTAGTFHGLLAQDVKQVVDEYNEPDFAGWVLMDPNDKESTQGVRYTEFIAPLIKAVQELSTKVVELENKISVLQSTN